MKSRKIAVIGGGVVGCTTALVLSQNGHNVTVIDPDFSLKSDKSDQLNGSRASLGILMGYMYKKKSGRGWHLRKRSMELWPKIIEEISTEKEPLKIEKPLIRLATSEKEQEYIEQLLIEKQSFKIFHLDKIISKTFKENYVLH